MSYAAATRRWYGSGSSTPPSLMSHALSRVSNVCSTCAQAGAEGAADNLIMRGAVAQLVERLHGMQEVARSSRVSSTSISLGFSFGGLIAGEGSFCVTSQASAVQRR